MEYFPWLSEGKSCPVLNESTTQHSKQKTKKARQPYSTYSTFQKHKSPLTEKEVSAEVCKFQPK